MIVEREAFAEHPPERIVTAMLAMMAIRQVSIRHMPVWVMPVRMMAIRVMTVGGISIRHVMPAIGLCLCDTVEGKRRDHRGCEHGSSELCHE